MVEASNISVAPALPARPAVQAELRLSSLKRAQLIDALGRYLITSAGLLVLISVGMILVFLLLQALPLILDPVKHEQGTLPKMFVPQLYDGYSQTQWMWQTEATSGGTEKFGVPLLIWGTLKGAFWAMCTSVPLALLCAIFISEFATHRWRTVIKSSIELLAGVPTVVVGFIAFVILSTLVNEYYVAHTAYFRDGQWVLFPVQLLAFAFAASYGAAKALRLRRHAAVKALALIAALALSAAAVMLLGRVLEAVLGGGLRPVFGVDKYTQLNGILAGFCLGFAIIPIVFSVAEDAMRAIPNSYREASLALGGSKWETALWVILPAATPGVMAAVMLGLARAVGETMIVLMASGNTPILDLSPFTGMRTMSAAIAIEASEKAQGSTGYHVLFFVGALLFLMTFVLNSATEWIISRLKSRYRIG